jgi:hypothetical protein
VSPFDSEPFTNLERDPVPHPDPPDEPVPAVVVTEDTLIARPELGPDTFTFVAAGDVVPPGLVDAYEQARPAKPARRATRKS